MKRRTLFFTIALCLLASASHDAAFCQDEPGDRPGGKAQSSASAHSFETARVLFADMAKAKVLGRSAAVAARAYISESSGILLVGSVGGSYAPLAASRPEAVDNVQDRDEGSAGDGADGGLPTDYALFQNYPNPFNPTAVIRYALPVEASVTLKVYDVIGREVETLVNGAVQDPGYRSVVFDAGASAGGVYFCRMTAAATSTGSTFSDVMKMLLAR